MHTGIDRGAQLALRWDAIDLHARIIHTERRKGRRQGSVPVQVAINDELLAVLRALPSRLTSPWVFPNADDTGPIEGREFDRLVFRPALKRARISNFRWKDLRHTFASRLRMAGVEPQTIRDLMGHTTMRMTERYAHLAPGLHQEAVQRISRTTSPSSDAERSDPSSDPTAISGRSAAQ